MQIFCFGDSTVYGAWERGGGWVDRLKRSAVDFLETHPGKYLEIYNLGIPGDKTDGLAQRFTSETKQRVANYKGELLFLFAFGANDAAFVPGTQEFRCPLERFEANYRQVLREAKSLTDQVFVLTITPVNEEQCNPTEKSRMNAFVERYNSRLAHLAEEEGANVIDIHSAFHEQGTQDLLSRDGIHPNARGYELIYSVVSERISKLFC